MNLPILLGTALLLRIALIIFAHWQDANLDVKYTDIDYRVFTNASKFVVAGKSPFEEETYRYTPLLAFLLFPNVWWLDFGKCLFVACDLVAAWLIYQLIFLVLDVDGAQRLQRRDIHQASNSNALHVERDALLAVAVWLFNPLTFVVSSRGNAESILAVLILGTLYCLYCRQYFAAAFFHGIAAHFKLYPIIYLPAVILHLTFVQLPSLRDKDKFQGDTDRFARFRWSARGLFDICGAVFNRSALTYCATFGSSCVLLFLTCYALYGNDFLEQTYLYHITRRDPQHNFSWLFYLYHRFQNAPQSVDLVLSLCAFLPQLCSICWASFSFYQDLPLAWFLSTALFVSFNKVCTSQYFLWYLSLLPLLVPKTRLSLRRAACLICLWFSAQGIWLLFAYLLEYKKWNVVIAVWISSILFLLTNLYILYHITVSYDRVPARKHAE